MNSELRVNEGESFDEASEVRTDYLQHLQIFLIPINID